MIIITIKSTCVGEHEEKNEYDIKSLCMHYILTLWAQTLIKSHLKLKKQITMKINFFDLVIFVLFLLFVILREGNYDYWYFYLQFY